MPNPRSGYEARHSRSAAVGGHVQRTAQNVGAVAHCSHSHSGTTVFRVAGKALAIVNELQQSLNLELGGEIARKLKESGVETVVFDRGGYLYHGRVKALADGAREKGLKF